MTELEKVAKMTAEEKAAYILAMQPPSTRAALQRPVEEDIAWFRREIPKSAQIRDKDGNIDVAPRSISYEEAVIHQRNRYNRGQYIAEMRGEGDANSVTPEKKNAAVTAFMFVKTKFKDLMKACGLVSEKEYAEFKREK